MHCAVVLVLNCLGLVHRNEVKMSAESYSVPHEQSVGVNMAADAAHPQATVADE